MKRIVKIRQTLLWVSAICAYAATYFALRLAATPYDILALPALVLIELLLRAPLKSATAAACDLAAEGGEVSSARCGCRRAQIQKAIALQVRLWWVRLLRYALVFLPAACLAALSDRLYDTVHLAYNEVLALICLVFSCACLLVGVAFVEYGMLRYMAAWYLLPRCDHAKQAVQCAKRLSLYCMEDIAELCLHTVPFAFSVSRAVWINSQLKCSKHAYNFCENTKTVTGITNA